MMLTPMYGGTSTKTVVPPVQRIFVVLVAGAAMFCIFLLIPLILFLMPYHNLKMRAAAFDASPNCQAALAPAAMPSAASTPCTLEWANVLVRYYTSSHSSRSGPSYRYYLHVRGGYGDEQTVQLMDSGVWWRISKGDAIKMQRWGDSLTAVTLMSGETSPTAQNPDWQLNNDLRGLRVFVILFVVLASVEVATLLLMRQMLSQRSA